MIEVMAVENFTPTSTKTTEGWSKGPVTIHNIKGYQIIELKVGSKLIDRYSSKGTVCEIRKDSEMPIVAVGNKKVRVELIYNPSVYKRKVGFAYKIEEAVGFHYWLQTNGAENGEKVQIPDSLDYKTIFKTEDQTGKQINIQRKYKIVSNGKEEYSCAVGLHFFMHLDHDPERKLQYSTKAQNRVTLIDREYLKKMGYRIKVKTERANQIGICIGKSVSIENDLPIFTDVETSIPENAFKIEKRIQKEHMYTDIGLLQRSAVEGTVGDPRLKTQYAYIETDLGTVLIPPGCFEALEDKKNSMVLTTELVNANNILAEQFSINFLKYKLGTREVQANQVLIGDFNRKIRFGLAKLERLINQYRIKVAKRFINELSKSYNMRLPGIYGVATADNNLPIDTVGIPRNIWKRLKRFSNTHGLFRRHPIHRIYNCMPVKLVPVEGNTIRVNESLQRLADGKVDGDHDIINHEIHWKKILSR